MLKKTLLSAAIASTFALSGCLDDTPSTGENAGAVTNPDTESAKYVFPIFSPAESKLPIPNDLIFQKTDTDAGTVADGTFKIGDTSPPVTTALNELSGASTIAPIDIAMSGVIDASTVIGPEDGDLPNQNVFLVELTYASGEPVRALSLPSSTKTVTYSEPPIPANAVVAGGLGFGSVQPNYSVEVIELDGVSTIRINPEEPLDPKTRYVVAITNSIKDIYGDRIGQSPGAAGYKALSKSSTKLQGSLSALIPVQSLITKLWEKTALAYINNITVPGIGELRGTNPAVPVVDSNSIASAPAGVNSLALSYSFTTSDDAQVLTYMADPAQWLADTVESSVVLTATDATVKSITDGGGTPSFADIYPQVTSAKNNFDPSNISSPLLDGCANADFACVGTTIVTQLEAGNLPNLPAKSYFPDAESRTVTLGSTTDAIQISALISPLFPTGTNPYTNPVSVTQGTIELPYYLDEPGTTGAGIVTGSWQADSSLAAVMSGVLGASIPQADATKSTAVNGIFPFPKEKSKQTVPMLAIYPTTNGGNMKTVIFQHGITSDRSAALAFGTSLVHGAKVAGHDIAVIAIDQPLHGIAGISPAEQAALTEQLLVSGGQLSDDRDDPANDDFDGQRDDAGEQATIDAVVAEQYAAGIVTKIDPACPGIDVAGTDLTTAIGLTLSGTCDGLGLDTNLGGKEPSAAVGGALVLERTIANGATTIPGLGQGSDSERHFGFTANAAAQPVAMDYNGSSSANGSGSLFINLGNFLASRDNLRQGTVDLLNLRASLNGLDLNGADAGGTLNADKDNTFFIGHSLGTVNGLAFVKVLENTTSLTDNVTAANLLTPGGGVVRLIENSPTFGPTILAGLGAKGVYQDSSSFQTFLNVLQAAADSGDSINFAKGLSTRTLLSVVIGDKVIPNEITSVVDLAPSLPGAGSIAPLSGTEPLVEVAGASGNVITGPAGAKALSQSVARYTSGTHGTPVYPASAAESAIFTEMVKQAASIVISGGLGMNVADDSVLQ